MFCMAVRVPLAAEDEPQPREVRAGTLFRPGDARPRHDDAQAAKLSVERYDSKRLRLYTDIEPEVAKTLPPLVDQAYDAMAACFADLPPAKDGSDFQMTGYLMRDRERFRKLGMLKEDLPRFLHGRHFGAEFWMDDQELPYYREHLLLHEATHCFMTITPGPKQPLWYLEGMAEFFGAHRKGKDGKFDFGVIPIAKNEFPGFGRIGVIHREQREGRGRSLSSVFNLVQEFAPQTSEPYAWSWAVCVFLDRHPRYRDRFHSIHKTIRTLPLREAWDREFDADLVELATEWRQFSHHIVENYDFERAVIDFKRGEPLPKAGQGDIAIAADRGWQSTGVWIEAGKTYRLETTGEVVLGKSTKPWISGPDGISLRYAEGRPIGRLLAAVHADDAEPRIRTTSLLEILGEGATFEIKSSADGTLYLRVNDAWNSLADNTDEFAVRVNLSNPAP
jgi:hypothetical protein